MMRVALKLLLSALLAFVGSLASSSSVTAATELHAQVHVHEYNAPANGEPKTLTDPGFGLPATYDYACNEMAVLPASGDAHTAMTPPRSGVTCTHTAYDLRASLVQLGRTTGTTSGRVQSINGDLSSFERWHVAANTPARFAVNSAGEATLSLRAGSSSLEVSEHAALRMTQRGVSIDAAEAALAQKPFQYFHNQVWKSGYYNSASGVFLGSMNGRITTVIGRASTNYIDNLKAAVP